MKRLFDLVGASLMLIAIFPILLLVALSVRCTLGTPVLFVQTRAGRNGKLFTLVKFRTMKSARGGDGHPLPDSERQHWYGAFLRKSSLDELPELWNIIRGDMSFVGPRPLLPEYLSVYNSRQARRHEVSPGLTGWAQVNGRNAVSWKERLEMDVWYVENRSCSLDLLILLRTIWTVLSRSGASPEGQVSMEAFTGTPEEAFSPNKAS